MRFTANERSPCWRRVPACVESLGCRGRIETGLSKRVRYGHRRDADRRLREATWRGLRRAQPTVTILSIPLLTAAIALLVAGLRRACGRVARGRRRPWRV